MKHELKVFKLNYICFFLIVVDVPLDERRGLYSSAEPATQPAGIKQGFYCIYKKYNYIDGHSGLSS